MKTFASAILLAASVSAGFDKLINFDFNDYFVKTERSEKPALGAYDYNWSKASNSGDYLASLWLMGDMVAEYTLPFDDTADGVSWTLTFNPQLTLGGKQTLTLETPYLAVDFFLDIWPGKLSVGKTQLKWDPPLFENFCMSSGWSLTLLDFWLSMDISVWECDAGLFDWILNGDGYECGKLNCPECGKGGSLDGGNGARVGGNGARVGGKGSGPYGGGEGIFGSRPRLPTPPVGPPPSAAASAAALSAGRCRPCSTCAGAAPRALRAKLGERSGL